VLVLDKEGVVVVGIGGKDNGVLAGEGFFFCDPLLSLSVFYFFFFFFFSFFFSPSLMQNCPLDC
jgi:hypothetical protein